MVGTDQTTEHDTNRAADELIGGIGSVLNTALGVVGDLARRAAEATLTPERTVAQPAPGATPVNVVVHYGAATVANIVEIAGKAVRSANTTARGAAAPSGGPTASGAQRPVPTVSAGEVLRIPLSIENPDAQPMQQLRFAALSVHHEDSTSGSELRMDALRFDPPTLTIAPHDFEKLTVFIDTQIDTAPGRYEAVIALIDTAHQITVRFAVVAKASPSVPQPPLDAAPASPAADGNADAAV
jgi:hypothetical protein